MKNNLTELVRVLSNLNDASDLSHMRERFQVCANHDFLRNAIPKEFGGLDNGFGELSSAFCELGYCSIDPGIILSLNAHLWGLVFPLLKFGSEQQKSEFFPDILQGSIVAGHAITEPEIGSDLKNIKTHYAVNGNETILNGHKRWITNTPIADWLVIYAKQDTGNKLSAYLVAKDDIGVVFQNGPHVDAFQHAAMGDIILDNCRIPSDRLLGSEGMGGTILQYALELERVFLFSGIYGIMRWQFEHVLSYAQKRRINDSVLFNVQVIRHKLADMSTRLETCRLFLENCIQMKDAAKKMPKQSSQTKLMLSDLFLESSLDSVQIMGAAGLNDKRISGMVHIALASQILSGTTEIQKNIIAGVIC